MDFEKAAKIIEDARERFALLYDKPYDPYRSYNSEELKKAAKLMAGLFKEAPEMIPPTNFSLDQPSHNASLYLKLNEKNPINSLRLKDGLVLNEYPNQVALMDTNEGRLKYFLNYKEDTFLGHSGVTQILLWRSRDPGMLKFVIDDYKITEYVFYRVLLDSYDCIVKKVGHNCLD